MREVKIGKFPGKVDTYTLEDETRVRDALEMAGIAVEPEQEIKMDGETVDMDRLVTGSMLLVTKRLKGAR